MISKRKRRKPVSDINVVPYIDVMLVLLVIFMATAPLMNLGGIDVELPQTNAKPLQQKDEPLLVTVDKGGVLFLTMGKGKPEQMDEATLQKQIAAIVGQNPTTTVLIAADSAVDYGRVYQAMAIMQAAQVPRVGFISKPDKGK